MQPLQDNLKTVVKSKPMPKISVIVPNYNHARFLRNRIDTILKQTLQDFELILLDDCSTDDSRSILSSYANDPAGQHRVQQSRTPAALSNNGTKA